MCACNIKRANFLKVQWQVVWATDTASAGRMQPAGRMLCTHGLDQSLKLCGGHVVMTTAFAVLYGVCGICNCIVYQSLYEMRGCIVVGII